MYREVNGITEKIVSYCCRMFKKSEYFTRFKALGETKVDFVTEFYNTKYERMGLKSVYLQGYINEKDDIIAEHLEYDIDILYFMYYDKNMFKMSVFNITSLTGLNKLVNEELEVILGDNVFLKCKLEEPVCIFSNMIVSNDTNLLFVDKLRDLYINNILLKGTLTIKQLERNQVSNNILFVENIFNKVDKILKYTDLDEFILDFRNYDRTNFYYLMQSNSEKFSITNNVLTYLSNHLNEFNFDNKVYIRILFSELELKDESVLNNIKLLMNHILSKISNIGFYIINGKSCLSVTDYLESYNEYLKVEREKFKKIHII